MPISTDITMPRAVTPIFPDRCVGCGLPGPDSQFRVGTNSIGWWTLVFWLPGRRFAVDVPTCEACRLQMARRRRYRRLVEWSMMLLAVGAAIYLLDGYRGPFRKWLAMGIALTGMLPWFLWEIVAPPPIDLTVYSKTVQYEFRDAGYAEEFLSLNQ